jgi:hypothetical protein
LHITRTKTVLAILTVAAAVVPLGSSLASGATPAAKPAAGVIHVFVTSVGNVPASSVLITGAFSDHGTNPNGNGNTTVLHLKKGNITVNVAKINAITNAPNFGTFNAASCSFTGLANGPVTLVRGTGAYVGIKGTVHVNLAEAGQFPLRKNGKCNTSNSAVPLAFDFIVTGAGKASF